MTMVITTEQLIYCDGDDAFFAITPGYKPMLTVCAKTVGGLRSS